MALKGVFENHPPIGKLTILLIIVLLSTLLISLLSILAALPFGGMNNMMLFLSNSYDSNSIMFLKWLQISQSVGIFILPAVIVAYLFSKDGASSYLYLNTKLKPNMVLLSLLIMVVSLPVISELTKWNSQMVFPECLKGVENWMRAKEDQAQQLTDLFLDSKTGGDFWMNILMIGIIPGIGEELLFRGVIQRILKEWTKNDHWAIWLTAIFFSAIHLQFYGFVPRVILGAMFGYILVLGKSLWLPIIAHFMNNSMAVVAYHLSNIGVSHTDPDKIGDTSLIVAVICADVVVLLFFIMWRRSRSKKISIGF